MNACATYLTVVMMTVSPATAQTTALDCVPAMRPIQYGEAELNADLAAGMRAEFQTYFDDMQTYFDCLSDAQKTASIEVKEVLEDYSATFGSGAP
jgi:hypothetical protein